MTSTSPADLPPPYTPAPTSPPLPGMVSPEAVAQQSGGYKQQNPYMPPPQPNMNQPYPPPQAGYYKQGAMATPMPQSMHTTISYGQRHPQTQTIYVVDNSQAQRRMAEQQAAEDCCFFTCCWTMICCCLAAD